MEPKELFNLIYPLTIVIDRYSGVYSRGKFLAFNLELEYIPKEIGGCDSEELRFWKTSKEFNKYIIGKGDTPNDAFIDLLIKMYESDRYELFNEKVKERIKSLVV